MSRPRSLILLFAAVFSSYIAGGRFAFSLLNVTDLGAVFFAPAGVTVAALILTPVRRWWVVVLAAGGAECTLDLWLGDYSAVGLSGFMAANLAEPLLAASLLRATVEGTPDLARTSHLVTFVAAAGVVGPAAGGAIGTAAAGHENSELDYGATFVQWWLGDSLGVILVGGAIVALAAAGADRRTLRSLEGAALMIATPAVAALIYWTTDVDVGFILLIAAMTAAVRFGTRAVSLVSLVIAVIALSSLPATGELMTGVDNDEALILIKLQFAAFAVAGLTVAAEAAARDRTTEQITRARKSVADLQQALLPLSEISGRSFNAIGSYQAAGSRIEVGGDWYDVSESSEGVVTIAIGDLVGHGPEAVAAMGQLRFAMAGLTAAGLSPGRALVELDQRVRELPGAMASSAWVATFDPDTNELTYSAAGHPPPLLRLADPQWHWLEEARAPLLGVHTGPRPEHTMRLERPATIVAYTDGAVERRSEHIDDGLARLRAALDTNPDATPAEILEAITDSSRSDDAVLVRVDLMADSRPSAKRKVHAGRGPAIAS